MKKHWHKVHVTSEDMAQAVREGLARQADARAKGYVPYGAGSSETHVTGRLGELAFAKYLGVPAPDPSYAADKRRGCDVLGPDGTRYHVRSSKYPGASMMIKPRDPDGIYVQLLTTGDGFCWLTGWYTRKEAELNFQLRGMRVDPSRRIWEIPQDDLYPFAATGYAQAA